MSAVQLGACMSAQKHPAQLTRRLTRVPGASNIHLAHMLSGCQQLLPAGARAVQQNTGDRPAFTCKCSGKACKSSAAAGAPTLQQRKLLHLCRRQHDAKGVVWHVAAHKAASSFHRCLELPLCFGLLGAGVQGNQILHAHWSVRQGAIVYRNC